MKKQFTRLIGTCCVSVFLFLISTTGAFAQYCAGASTNTTDEWLTNVEFAGINNPSTSTTYSDFTSIVGTVTPGISYEFTGTIGQSSAYPETVTVYIDWDQSGSWEASERYAIGSCSSNGCTVSADIEVPIDASPGETRMRVVEKYSSASTDPCGSFTWGEVEDYTILVQSGECTPPSLTYTVTNNCANDTYALVVVIDSLGSSASGTIFHKRSDGVSMSSTPLLAQLVGLPLTISNSIPFGVTVRDSIVSGNPICTLIRNFAQLYCHIDGEICDAPIVVSELPFNDAGNTSAYLNDYNNADVPPVSSGVIGTGSFSGYYINGYDVVYSYTPDINEAIDISTTNDAGYVGLYAFTNCPFDSTVGFHIDYTGTTRTIQHLPVLAGTTYYIVISSYGGILDSTNYTLTITKYEDCAGTPSAGTVDGDMMVCAAFPFTLVASGESIPANGLVFSWQSSPAGQNQWTDVAGANLPTYTFMDGVVVPTDFRLKAYCTGTDQTAYSNIVAITLNPAYNECYCIPSGATNNSDEILNFTFANINNTSAPSAGITGYSNYTDSVAAAEIVPGESYVASLTSNTGSGNHGAAIWIDYNDNGAFEAFEKVTVLPSSIGGGVTVSFPSFEVENMPGMHRLRVQYRYSVAGAALDPCVASTYTETEDYLVNVANLDACSGTPEAGTVDENQLSVCANIAFVLNVSGVSDLADGLIRIWQSSPAGEGNWTNVANATSPSYTVANGIQVPTDFRYKVACTNSNQTDFSDVVQVSLNPAVECYCTPSNSYSTSYFISNVSTNGALQDINRASGFTAGGYADYTATDTLIVYATQGFDFSVSWPSSTYNVGVWVDLNQNGSFADAGEQIILSGYGSSPYLGAITIPDSVADGSYRMRVRANYIGTPVPCGDDDYAEAEDYVLKIITLNECAGTPTAGTIQDDSFNVCASNLFNLTVSGATSPASGLERNWQSSPAGQSEWADIEGATSLSYNVDGGINTPTDFRYRVTCVNSSETVYSNVVEVGVNPAIECYCTPSNTGNTTYFINSVSTSGALQDLDRSSGFTTGGYADYTATDTLIVHVNQEIDFSVSWPSSTYQVGVWVDFNQNGSFADADEQIIANGYVSAPFEGTIVIPDSLADGSYRMRVRASYLSTPSACGIDNYTEAEDYVLKVITLTGCQGTPTAGTVQDDSFNVCASNQFNLTVSGSTSPAEALERNWQSSPAGLNEWADIPDATSTNYNVVSGIFTPTDFRYRVTCLNSNETDYSNVVAVGLNPGNECYCTPTGATNNADEILNFTFANINNTSAPSEGVAGYSDYTDTVAAAEIVPGESYVASLTSNSGSGNHGAAIWIDYNDNGVFEAFEKVTSLPSSISGSATVSFPSFEVENMPGLHRLRVQYRYNVAGSALDPCVASTFTDTEDYMVNVAQLEGCFGTPEGGTVDENEISICPNVAFELNVSGASDLADGLTRNWQSSPAGDGNWTDVANATSPSYIVANGINVPTDFRYKVECANSNETDVSDVVQVSLNPALECYCIPTNGYSSSYAISNFSTNGALQDVNNSSGFTAGGYADYTQTDTIIVYAGLEFNISASSTISSTYQYNVWIDLNQNGSFADAGEDVLSTGTSYVSNPYLAAYIVPSTLAPGSYRLRIRNAYLSAPAPACGDFDYGEAEDYIVKVIQLFPCSGTPDAGIADANQLGVCGGAPFTLSVSGSSEPADGLVTNWQSSIDNGETWTDIFGATTPTYVHPGVSQATLFRYSATCTFSQESDFSNVIGTSLNPANECYCTPTTTNNNYYITGFSATGNGGVDISNTPTGSSLDGSGYSDYTNLPALTASAGGVVTFTADVNTSSNAGFRIWVDWGQNGTFGDQASGESNEVVYSSIGYLYTHTGSFTIPESASGNYRIRIASAYIGINGPDSPCELGWGGEYEDYMLNVSELTTASLTGTIANWTSACGGRAATVKLYEPGTANLVATYNTTVLANGTYTVDDVAIGTFDVIVKVSGYLAKGTQDLVIVAGDNSYSVGPMSGGDVNNDNSVNILDVTSFSSAYASGSGNPAYNVLTDLNCDGSVTILDITSLSQTYGMTGASAPLGN